MRRILHFPRKVFRAILALVLAAGCIVLILVHTHVGREAVRLQVQSWFDARYEGSLEIGVLRGNLLNTLYASRVRLLDGDRQVVLDIDSVVVRPSWSDFFDRSFTVRRLDLYQPSVELVRDTTGVWNLRRALSRRLPAEEPPDEQEPWHFVSADVRVHGGQFALLNFGTVPEPILRGHIFDYLNTGFVTIDLRTTVDVRPNYKLLDVLEFSARAVGPDQPIAAHGQVLVRDREVSLNAFLLDLGMSRLALQGTVSDVDPFSRLGVAEVAAAHLDLDVLPSRIRGIDVHRFFPTFPIGQDLEFVARLSGPVSNLSIERLSLNSGRSAVHLAGRLRGLPDSASVVLDVQPSHLESTDLAHVVPDVARSPFSTIDSVDFQGTLRGILNLADGSGGMVWATDLDMEVITGAGGGALQARASRTHGGQIRYQASADVSRLRAHMLFPESPDKTELNGRIQLEGSSLGAERRMVLALDLGPSVVAGRRIDLFDGDLERVGTQWRAVVTAYEDDAWVRLDATAEFGSPRATYNVIAETGNLDLEPLFLGMAPPSRIDGTVSIRGAGSSLADLTIEGEVTTTSASIGQGERRIEDLTSRTVLRLSRPSPGQTEAVIQGDLLDGSLYGTYEPDILLKSIAHWARAFDRTIASQARMPFRSVQPVAAREPVDAAAEEARLREALREAGFGDQIDVAGFVHLKRADLLQTLQSDIGLFPVGLNARFDAALGAHRLAVQGTIAADSADTGFLGASGLRTRFDLSTRYAATLEASSEGSLTVEAEMVRVGIQRMEDFTLDADLGGRRSRMAVRGTPEAGGSFQTEANLYFLSDRNRFTINRFLLETREQRWRNAKIASIDLYEGGTVVRNLVFENQPDSASGSGNLLQRVQAEGAVSSLAEDSLLITATNLRVDQIAELFTTRLGIGGTLDTRLALSAGRGALEATGRLSVENATLKGYNIGRLDVSSQFGQDLEEGIRLDLRLAQNHPDGPASKVNDLVLSGSLQPGPSGTAIDIDVDMRRVDFFFLDLLFSDEIEGTTGYATGRGRIGGTLSHPLFEGSFRGHDVAIYVPDYNLRYRINGPFAVDQAGFHFRDVDLTDTGRGRAVVNGSLLFNDYRFFSFDLSAQTSDLLVMNVGTFSPDMAFYGFIRTSGTFTLDGPIYAAQLRSADGSTTPDSRLFIPVTDVIDQGDTGFIIMADSTGQFPEVDSYLRRRNLVAKRAAGERRFVDGLEMNLNFDAPAGSTFHLVFDPVLGDVINAVGSGRIQLLRQGGEYFTYGTFRVDSGDYLFTATEVFVRRFLLEPGGTITWDGDPIDGVLDIPATYRTRASLAGLPGFATDRYDTAPFLIRMGITGRVTSPLVDLRIELDRDERTSQGTQEGIESLLNRADLTAEYATSVLLTNTFLLTTSQPSSIGQAADQLLFNSLSQLVASQVNRFISEVISNLDVNVGLQQGRSIEELDLSYGFALRLLDERLVIRGEGVYRGDQTRREAEGLNGELAVEIRLNPNILLEVFYRREGDPLNVATSLGSAYGAGLVYQTEFSNWPAFLRRLTGGSDDRTSVREDPESPPATSGTPNQ